MTSEKVSSVVHPHHVIRVTELLEQSLIQFLLLTHHCFSQSCVCILTFTTVITSQHGLRLITVTDIWICIIMSCIFLHWIKSLHLEKTQSNSMRPTAIVTVCKYLIGSWWCVSRSILCPSGQWRTQKIFMGGFQSAKIFLCTKIESMIRKNIKQAAIQYVNVVKQL